LFLKGRNHLGLGGDTALGVGHLDTEGLGLGEDVDTLAGGDGVGDPVLVSGVISSVRMVSWTYSAA
jgi:hypothetical protein